MKRIVFALLVIGACQAALASEPAPVTPSAEATRASAPTGPGDTDLDAAGTHCGTGPGSAVDVDGARWPGAAPAAPAIKCSTTVCTSLPCCAPYACVTGRCLID